VLDLAPTNALDYDRDPGHWFSERQIALMYEQNPLWTSIELRVYGELYDPNGQTDLALHG
jgi:hypothetical protein